MTTPNPVKLHFKPNMARAGQPPKLQAATPSAGASNEAEMTMREVKGKAFQEVFCEDCGASGHLRCPGTPRQEMVATGPFSVPPEQQRKPRAQKPNVEIVISESCLADDKDKGKAKDADPLPKLIEITGVTDGAIEIDMAHSSLADDKGKAKEAEPLPKLIEIAGVTNGAKEWSGYFHASKEQLPKRSYKLPPVGVYDDVHSGAELVAYFKDNLVALEGSYDRSFEFCRQLVEDLHILRLLGELGRRFHDSEDAMYTWDKDAFNLHHLHDTTEPEKVSPSVSPSDSTNTLLNSGCIPPPSNASCLPLASHQDSVAAQSSNAQGSGTTKDSIASNNEWSISTLVSSLTSLPASVLAAFFSVVICDFVCELVENSSRWAAMLDHIGNYASLEVVIRGSQIYKTLQSRLDGFCRAYIDLLSDRTDLRQYLSRVASTTVDSLLIRRRYALLSSQLELPAVEAGSAAMRALEASSPALAAAALRHLRLSPSVTLIPPSYDWIKKGHAFRVASAGNLYAAAAVQPTGVAGTFDEENPLQKRRIELESYRGWQSPIERIAKSEIRRWHGAIGDHPVAWQIGPMAALMNTFKLRSPMRVPPLPNQWDLPVLFAPKGPKPGHQLSRDGQGRVVELPVTGSVRQGPSVGRVSTLGELQKQLRGKVVCECTSVFATTDRFIRERIGGSDESRSIFHDALMQPGTGPNVVLIVGPGVAGRSEAMADALGRLKRVYGDGKIFVASISMRGFTTFHSKRRVFLCDDHHAQWLLVWESSANWSSQGAFTDAIENPYADVNKVSEETGVLVNYPIDSQEACAIIDEESDWLKDAADDGRLTPLIFGKGKSQVAQIPTMSTVALADKDSLQQRFHAVAMSSQQNALIKPRIVGDMPALPRSHPASSYNISSANDRALAESLAVDSPRLTSSSTALSSADHAASTPDVRHDAQPADVKPQAWSLESRRRRQAQHESLGSDDRQLAAQRGVAVDVQTQYYCCQWGDCQAVFTDALSLAKHLWIGEKAHCAPPKGEVGGWTTQHTSCQWHGCAEKELKSTSALMRHTLSHSRVTLQCSKRCGHEVQAVWINKQGELTPNNKAYFDAHEAQCKGPSLPTAAA